jgi:hypothetical protein
MISRAAVSLYQLNLIRDLREREIRTEKKKRLSVILSLGCFGFFALSVLYSGLTIWQMERVLSQEKDKLERLRVEYQKYAASKLIVDKTDIELLSGLQGKGLFWTRKLAAMAKHLPDNYWITQFEYNNEMLHVKGYGLPNPHQDQLMVLDDYLNRLRGDSTFSDIFTKIYLNQTNRAEDNGRVGFEFSAVTRNWKAQ